VCSWDAPIAVRRAVVEVAVAVTVAVMPAMVGAEYSLDMRCFRCNRHRGGASRSDTRID